MMTLWTECDKDKDTLLNCAEFCDFACKNTEKMK